MVDGFVGWSVGENLMGGTVRVQGNASECAGASSHGGTMIIEGDASLPGRHLAEGRHDPRRPATSAT